MGCERRHRSGAQVAGDADFERDLICRQMRNQSWVLDSPNSVADTLGADFERFPYAPGTRHLAGVTREPQAAITSVAKETGKEARGPALFIASEADRNHSFAYALGGKIEHRFGGLRAELPNSVEN